MGQPDSNRMRPPRNFARFGRAQCTEKPGVFSSRTKPNPKFFVNDPFPYINNRHGGQSSLYLEAVKAYQVFQTINIEFGKNYRLIKYLETETIMKLDANGKFMMTFSNNVRLNRKPKPKTLTPLEKNILNHADQGYELFSPKLLVILGSVERLLEIQKDMDERDLAMHQAGKRRSEAQKRKLIFSIRTLAASQAMFNYGERLIYLKKKFLKFEEKRNQLDSFLAIEQQISGKTNETKAHRNRL